MSLIGAGWSKLGFAAGAAIFALILGFIGFSIVLLAYFFILIVIIFILSILASFMTGPAAEGLGIAALGFEAAWIMMMWAYALLVFLLAVIFVLALGLVILLADSLINIVLRPQGIGIGGSFFGDMKAGWTRFWEGIPEGLDWAKRMTDQFFILEEDKAKGLLGWLGKKVSDGAGWAADKVKGVGKWIKSWFD